jgi:N-acetylmuramoyl-L-alanine amidase
LIKFSDDVRRFFYSSAGAIALLLAALTAISYANGRKPPVLVREASFSDKHYLSLDDVTLAIHGRMTEHAEASGADLEFAAHKIEFVVASSTALVDGKPVALDASPVRDDRSMWVPRSFFAAGPLAGEFHQRIELGPLPAVAPAVAVAPKASFPSKEPVAPPAVKEESEEEKPAAVENVDEHKEIPHAIKRIVIDPGHGGKDPGTVGVHGTEEKNVNLWMGQELADALRDQDFEVLMTRTDDTFIPLAHRTALANRYKADLFISLHCNASLSNKLSGFEVYILSEKASDPHAAAVARLENSALELEGKAPPAPVQAVLRSLTKNAHINLAAQLGGIMDREVSEQLSIENAGLQQAAFYVLRGAEMPAVLVELGFLSNKAEEKKLKNKSYREKLIKAIAASIVEFDKKHQKKVS